MKTTLWLVLFGLEALVIIAGNSLVIAALTLSGLHRKRRYYLILNLSVADLMVGIVTIPLYLYVLYNEDHRSVHTAFIFFDILFGLESLLGLLTLSLERVYAVCWPIEHRIKRLNLMLLTGVTWFIAMVTGFTTLLKKSKPVFFFFILPLLTIIHICICTSYTVIWLKFRATPSIREHTHGGRSGQERKLAQTLFIITVLSLLAWLPAEILNIVLPLCVSCQTSLVTVFFVAKFLQFGNSFINPIIYALRIPEFRNSSWRIFSRYSSRRKFANRSCRRNKSTTLIVTCSLKN